MSTGTTSVAVERSFCSCDELNFSCSAETSSTTLGENPRQSSSSSLSEAIAEVPESFVKEDALFCK